MGQEISTLDMGQDAIATFSERLQQETKLLTQLFAENAFATEAKVCGFELEACLIGKDSNPVPRAEKFLANVNSPNIVPELACYNFELNGEPRAVSKQLLQDIQQELSLAWQDVELAASTVNADVVTIGTLPTISAQWLTMDSVFPRKRYRAIDKQVKQHLNGRAINVDIHGQVDAVRMQNCDVMLESAATSLQIHYQVNANNAARHYNAAHILSAPMIAACANSPYFLGKQLWEETRLPIFEQAVPLHSTNSQGPRFNRVGFGSGYVKESLLELFVENEQFFPLLLPFESQLGPEYFPHLNFHNGTIWRWNRPIVGVDSQGQPHLRIEHRVIPAGPTQLDMVANIALFVGLLHYFANKQIPPEKQLSFANASENAYQAARVGLDAKVLWLNDNTVNIRELLLTELIPHAAQGLVELGLDHCDVDYYLYDIIAKRVQAGMTGAMWQKQFVAKNGPDFSALVQEYLRGQQSGQPVHLW